MKADEVSTPSTEFLQHLFDLPSPCITQAMLEERESLRERLAAVEQEITELLLCEAPVELGALEVRCTQAGICVNVRRTL